MQFALRQATHLARSPICRMPRQSAWSSFARPQLSRSIITNRYTLEHEMVSYDDETGMGTIFITDHAQDALGDVVFVELPVLGTEVKQGDQIGAVESVKAASDIYAPVSGTVEEINELLNSEPGTLNRSPEEKGWLCKMKLSNTSEVKELLTEELYKKSYEEEEE